MDLNIRRVKKESVSELKTDALTLGMTLRELCIKKLGIEPERLEVESGHQDDDASGSGSGQTGAAKRKGKRTTVPVLPKTEGDEVGLHSVPAVRSELAGVGDGIARLPESRPPRGADEKCPHGNLNAAYCRAKGGEC